MTEPNWGREISSIVPLCLAFWSQVAQFQERMLGGHSPGPHMWGPTHWSTMHPGRVSPAAKCSSFLSHIEDYGWNHHNCFYHITSWQLWTSNFSYQTPAYILLLPAMETMVLHEPPHFLLSESCGHFINTLVSWQLASPQNGLPRNPIGYENMYLTIRHSHQHMVSQDEEPI